jgi:PiT family inorganic phosphate transporter
MMIILISILPAYFAIDLTKNPVTMQGNVSQIEKYIMKVDSTKLSAIEITHLGAVKKKLTDMNSVMILSETPSGVPKDKRFQVRQDIITIGRNVDKLLTSDNFKSKLSKAEIGLIKDNLKELKSNTEFAPWWVLLLISLSLGLGTMVGWKRIVVTIGEKIGKSHLSYAQGASAEIVAASTIAVSTSLGLPVSTTHVLSSGVAGSMVAHGGIQNLQWATIKNILIAWLVTIPVTVLVSGGLFLLLRWML